MSVIFSAYAEMLGEKSNNTGVLSIETARMSFSADDVSESRAYESICDVKTEMRVVKTGHLSGEIGVQCLCMMFPDGTEYIFKLQSDKELNIAFLSINKKQEYLKNHPQEDNERPVVKEEVMVDASNLPQENESKDSTATGNNMEKAESADVPAIMERPKDTDLTVISSIMLARQVTAQAKQQLKDIGEQRKKAQDFVQILKKMGKQSGVPDDNQIIQPDEEEGRSIEIPDTQEMVHGIPKAPANEGKVGISEVADALSEKYPADKNGIVQTASSENLANNEDDEITNDLFDALPEAANFDFDFDVEEATASIDDTKRERETLDIINQNYRNRYVYWCREFAFKCCDKIPEKTVHISETDNERYLFDVMNGRYTHMCETYESFAMPIYISKNSNSGLLECGDHGIYASDLISAYDVFLSQPNAKVAILSQAIKDSVKGNTGSGQMDLMCLMPDIVDDFNRGFREQLEYGKQLFQVPRSIAMAYAVQPLDDPLTAKAPNKFLCLDYDGEELMAVLIRREMDANGEPIFVRMGRFALKGEHPSYRELANRYIAIYREKYNNVPLTEKMIRDLIDTKLLQNLLLTSDNRPVVLCDNAAATDNVIDIWRDDEIVLELHKMILDDAQKISYQKNIRTYPICSFGYSDIVYGLNALDYGCLQIRKRAQANKPLWEEYLPDLTLAVHQNGTFADLKLISKKDQRQRVTSYLGKVVDIVVENGTIVLAAGKDHYDLPLDREVYGNMNKEKLARFTPADGPLAEDTQVELHVFYSYGDVDSYKLKAICPDGTVIESKWCDTEDLKNDPPVYKPVGLDAMDSNECDEIVNAFKQFVNRIKAPYAFRPDTLYGYKYDEKRAYSGYLGELNDRGYPFRKVRRYFDCDNQTKGVRRQIKAMLNEGVFDCVADVLSGKLPVGHNLAKGTSRRFPYRDQAEVLRENLQDICLEFGYLYKEKHPSIEKILNALKKKDVQIWAPITAYVARNDDPYGVWDSFSEALRAMKPEEDKTIYDLRAISNVCFLTPEWIFEFFHSATGREDVKWIIQNINSVIEREEWNKTKEKYNARKIRDVLELLLCICILKKEDPTILDCNAPSTKQLVKKLKKLDNDIREKQQSGKLKKDFNSRIKGVDKPAEYAKVNMVVYCLIQTLTGGDSINLVGFRDDNEE